MKKPVAAFLGLTALALGLGGCVALNISGAGNLGDVDLSAHVNPFTGSVGAEAGRNVRVGGTDTSVGVSTNGQDASVNTNTQFRGHHRR